MELKTESIASMLSTLVMMREFIITLPSSEVKGFKRKMSQIKHYNPDIEDRLSIRQVSEEGGVATLHCVLGKGKEVTYYEIKEVKDL